MTREEAIAGGFVTQTGAWLLDEARPETDGMLHLRGRDVMKLLIEQPIYPPLVPAGIYPLEYSRFKWQHVSDPQILYGTTAGGVKLILGIVADPQGDGYWLIGDDGGVFTYGRNVFYGSLAGDIIHGIIGGARSPSGNGYWLGATDGTVFAFGDATWYGGNVPASGEMVAVETAGGVDGYYQCDTQGHVYSFGSAPFYGGVPFTSDPIVGMAVCPDGSGYWLLDSTGHVYTYGDPGVGVINYYGNGDPAVGSPYTAIETTPTGLGYYLVTKRGHVYTFGDAVYHGGTSGMVLNDPISDIAVRPDGAGYWLVAEDGGIFTFGGIDFYGALPGVFEADYTEDGNYFDYADIVKDLLLWCGFWLYDGGVSPDVYGNIESTGAYGPEGLPLEMFDKKSPIEAITQIKEIVGYITWVDADGAFHFESPNWWEEGNFLSDGSRTNVLPEIDERVQLISYGVQSDDKTARDRIIISNDDPYLYPDISGLITTTVNLDNPILRGMLRPAMWSNGILTEPGDQQTMAALLGKQLMFMQRVGSVVCWANPMFELNDQCRIWERQTDEVYDHYIRGINTSHDFDTGQYTMTVTTHWLGRDWSGPGPNRNLLAGSARTAEAVGAPTIPPPLAPQQTVGIVSTEVVGQPLVLQPVPQTVDMASVAPAASVSNPFLVYAQTVLAGGVASGFVTGGPWDPIGGATRGTLKNAVVPGEGTTYTLVPVAAYAFTDGTRKTLPKP
jgi:hypothetical protein